MRIEHNIKIWPNAIKKYNPLRMPFYIAFRLSLHSPDLQYYIWEAHTTGRILALRLTEAADRGVRILVDDNNLIGRDSPIASLIPDR